MTPKFSILIMQFTANQMIELAMIWRQLLGHRYKLSRYGSTHVSKLLNRRAHTCKALSSFFNSSFSLNLISTRWRRDSLH